MNDPAFWYIMSGLFVIAGMLNIGRGLIRPDPRRTVRLILGAAAFVWALTTILYRFAGPLPGYVAGATALAIMLFAAFLSARQA